jgi:hypothetical protein
VHKRGGKKKHYVEAQPDQITDNKKTLRSNPEAELEASEWLKGTSILEEPAAFIIMIVTDLIQSVYYWTFELEPNFSLP